MGCGSENLVFAASTNDSTINDFTSGTTFNSITFAAGCGAITLAGNAINLSGGSTAITNNNNTGKMEVLNLPITYTSAPTITNVLGGDLRNWKSCNSGTFPVTITGAGSYPTWGGTWTGTGGFIYSGTGWISLYMTGTFTGDFSITGTGVVSLNTAGCLGNTRLVLSDGAIIDNTSAGDITLSTNNMQVWNGNFTFRGSHNLNLGTGAVSLGSSIRTVTTSASTSTLTVGGVISGSAGLTKAGVGTLILSGASSYTGTTTISNGILKLGATGDASNTPLGTIGGATIVSTGATLDLAGFTLGIAEALTLNGSGFAYGGALRNSGGSASFAGPITLGSATSINTDNQITLSGTLSSGSKDMIKVGSNTLLFTNNTVSINNLIINAGTINAGTSTINVSGNFNSNGSFIPGTSTVVMNGSTAQTISTLSTPSFYNVIINNTSGGVSLLGDVSIGSTGTVTLSSGILTTGAYTVDLGTAGSLSENATSVIAPTSYITGNIKATRDIGSTSGVQTFGGIGVDITETSLSNNSTVVIRTTGTARTGYGISSILRSFSINPTIDANLNGTMAFHYFDNEISGHSKPTIKIYKSVDNGSTWDLQKSSSNTQINTLNLSGISSFSEWTGSDAVSHPLPIELVQFSAIKHDENVNVSWTTASETNNEYFTLERSYDGEKWETIYVCDGIGTSTIEQTYSFIDRNARSGVNYYRLKQTDFDGQFTYSAVKSVLFDNNSFSVMVYPIPAKAEDITIAINGIKATQAVLRIIDETGRQIFNGQIDVSKKTCKLHLSDICYLTSGNYIICISVNGLVVKEKIIVQ